MNITQSPSPNFDARTLPVTMLVLHYTGMESGAAALARMCDEQAKVSAHYMVAEDGEVFQLVDEESRAWHAGLSNWGGEVNINSASIGIEIVNGGHDFGLPDFPKTQIKAVVGLCQDIIKRRSIEPPNIIAHSDIAPARKQDPGEKFPWESIAAQGVGYWPASADIQDQRILFTKNDEHAHIKIIQSALSYIGYGLDNSGVIDVPTIKVIEALQRRYRPKKIDGNLDVHMMEIITKLANFRKSGSTAG